MMNAARMIILKNVAACFHHLPTRVCSKHFTFPK